MYCFALSSRFARTSLQLGPLEIIHFLLKAWNIKPNFHEVLCYSFLFCLNQTNNLRLDFMIRFHYLPEVTFNKERRFWSEFLMFRVKTQDGSMETFFYVALTGLKPKVKTTFFDRDLALLSRSYKFKSCCLGHFLKFSKYFTIFNL